MLGIWRVRVRQRERMTVRRVRRVRRTNGKS